VEYILKNKSEGYVGGTGAVVLSGITTQDELIEAIIEPPENLSKFEYINAK
jgi:hypothetical protein